MCVSALTLCSDLTYDEGHVNSVVSPKPNASSRNQASHSATAVDKQDANVSSRSINEAGNRKCKSTYRDKATYMAVPEREV
jgi:hypothetical protein